jgi:hypothetical protein
MNFFGNNCKAATIVKLKCFLPKNNNIQYHLIMSSNPPVNNNGLELLANIATKEYYMIKNRQLMVITDLIQKIKNKTNSSLLRKYDIYYLQFIHRHICDYLDKPNENIYFVKLQYVKQIKEYADEFIQKTTLCQKYILEKFLNN